MGSPDVAVSDAGYSDDALASRPRVRGSGGRGAAVEAAGEVPEVPEGYAAETRFRTVAPDETIGTPPAGMMDMFRAMASSIVDAALASAKSDLASSTPLLPAAPERPGNEWIGLPQDEKSAMKALLDSQEKILVTLPKTQLADGKKTVWWCPQINGYTLQVARGVPVEIPESYYLLAVSCGEVAPLRKQDMALAPVTTYEPLDGQNSGTYISHQTAEKRAAGLVS